MTGNLTKAQQFELEKGRQQQAHERWLSIYFTIRVVVILLVGGSFLLAIVYFGVYLTVKESVGKDTNISYFLLWAVDANLHVYAAWGVGIAGCLYGFAERRHRKRVLQKKDAEIEKLMDAIKTIQSKEDKS